MASLGRLGWLGRVAVLGSLDGPVGHLALDDARIGPQPTRSERGREDLGDRVLMGGSDRQGGKIPAGCGRCGGRLERFG